MKNLRLRKSGQAFAWTPASEASVVERLAIDALDELQETFISEEE